MLIPGNRQPPPLVFLRGGHAHTRKSIPPSPSFPEGGGMLIPGNSLSTIRKFIHPPPGNLYPPPPVFLGGGVRISYTRRGGYSCPGTEPHSQHFFILNFFLLLNIDKLYQQILLTGSIGFLLLHSTCLILSFLMFSLKFSCICLSSAGSSCLFDKSAIFDILN